LSSDFPKKILGQFHHKVDFVVKHIVKDNLLARLQIASQGVQFFQRDFLIIQKILGLHRVSSSWFVRILYTTFGEMSIGFLKKF